MRKKTVAVTPSEFNLEDTLEAIRILWDARLAAYHHCDAVHTICVHAIDRLEKEVSTYFRG